MSVADNGILPYCIKVRKRMLKLDGKKKGTSLESVSYISEKGFASLERQR
jgi:hypothetical protein